MRYENLIMVLCMIVILVLFFSFLEMYTFPKQYRVIKTKFDINVPSMKENIDKYTKKKCNEMCDKGICLQYEEQKKKYEMCKKCQSKGLCYIPFRGSCEKCKMLKSCEEIYGCDGKGPRDPFLTECQTCWGKIY